MVGTILSVVLFVLLLTVPLMLVIAKRFLFICEPNEVLIFSGLRTGDGAGYRSVKGGRAWRYPLIEKVDRLDLTNMIIELTVQGAYSKGGIPLNVQGVANVKIAGHHPVLGNAVERLLGKPRADVIRIAKEVLEGNLRGVLSRLTPEEVNEDKLAFAEKLLDEAEPDLARLGLVLDTMKIQNVHDDRGYLDSIGRRQTAELLKRSRVAEANAVSASAIKSAENRRRARLKALEAKTNVFEAETERRLADAETLQEALVAEARGKVAALIAREEAAIGAETQRVEKVRLQLQAEVIEPAKAEMTAGISTAQGRAATILEEGRATDQVLRQMITVWKSAGPDARDIFLMQKFQVLLATLTDSISQVRVDRVTMLPSGQSQGTATQAVRLVEELKAGLGVDLPQILEDFSGKDRG